MKLTYGQLSTIIYNIVYAEAVDEEIEEVETLMEYLDNNEDSYTEVIGLCS